MEYTILKNEQIGEGTCNDNPDHVFHVRLEDGTEGWAAGPHGVSYDTVQDWLGTLGELAASREIAISIGCDG